MSQGESERHPQGHARVLKPSVGLAVDKGPLEAAGGKKQAHLSVKEGERARACPRMPVVTGAVTELSTAPSLPGALTLQKASPAPMGSLVSELREQSLGLPWQDLGTSFQGFLQHLCCFRSPGTPWALTTLACLPERII